MKTVKAKEMSRELPMQLEFLNVLKTELPTFKLWQSKRSPQERKTLDKEKGHSKTNTLVCLLHYNEIKGGILLGCSSNGNVMVTRKTTKEKTRKTTKE